ncbi:MAG: aminotransferase class IV, partial [Bacteroidetes bacterium]|nr:aminotransferase class IV [Bacteroidota bacterium]
MTDKTIAFFNGEYLPKSEVHISPDDRGFLFADGVYEVIRSYHGKLFRAKEHIRRLENSLAGIKIPYKAISDLEKIAEELISKNSLQRTDALVYIQITRGAYKRTHQFPVGNIVPTVYCC